MSKECANCGSTDTRKTNDNEYYLCGQSNYCNSCDEYFSNESNDERASKYAPDTIRIRRDWESDEDYQDRMDDLDNYTN